MIIIAHRGASGEFPENSLLAFEQAIIQGADGIELDIHFHQESGDFVVLHDPYLDKTTNGKGRYDTFSLKELKQLQLGAQQNLITLPEALALINGRVFVNIELKTTESSRLKLAQQLALLAELLLQAMTQYGFKKEQFILSSFNHLVLYQCKQHLPQFSRAALISHCPLDIALTIADLGVNFVNPNINCFNQALVDNAHRLGAKVLVYTVNRFEDIQRCVKYNVDGIFTSQPYQSRQLLKASKNT